MWNREYALDDDEAAICERAAKACDILGVRHLLMGHTPHFEGIVSGLFLLLACGGGMLGAGGWREGQESKRVCAEKGLKLTHFFL